MKLINSIISNKHNRQTGVKKWYGKLGYPLLLLLLLLVVLLIVESKHPYFFLQDDNRDSYLPYFVHNYESLLNGELALYNFHQFLGIPSMSQGQTAALYPLTYFSVFLSDFMFGHYFAAIEIQVIIHLMIGALGFYKFIVFLEKDPRLAVLGGLTWSLSSFIVYVSNSWCIVASVAAYFPWMLFFSFVLYKRPSLRNTICAVAVRLFLFYSGHMQYFIYSVIFEFITVMLYILFDSAQGEKIKNSVKYLIKYIKEYVYVFIFALPLLLPMWNQATSSAGRSGRLPFEQFSSQLFPIDQLLKGLFFPFLQVGEQTYASFRNLLNLSHIGYLPVILILMGAIDTFIIRSRKKEKKTIEWAIFIIPAYIAILWASTIVFNRLIYVIPVLNRFRWPFKVAFYLDFYLIVIAVLVLARFIKRLSWKENSKTLLIFVLIGVQAFNFVFLYTVSDYKDFGEHHGDSIPLEENLKDELVGGRIISMGFDIWKPTPENNHPYLTAHTMGFNYATLWGLDSFAGYDVLLSPANLKVSLGLNFDGILKDDSIPVDHLRKAGVKWYIAPIGKVDEYTQKLDAYGIVKKYEDENRVVFFDSNAYPMVFDANGEGVDSEGYHVSANTIEFNIDQKQTGNIVFNNIYTPLFEGYIDGEKVELTSLDDMYFSMLVPEGKHHIIVKYKDPYLIWGIYIVIAFLMLSLVVWVVKNYIRRHKASRVIGMNDVRIRRTS